jgi:hypothetical protein
MLSILVIDDWTYYYNYKCLSDILLLFLLLFILFALLFILFGLLFGL